jgi:hypothetical protein
MKNWKNLVVKLGSKITGNSLAGKNIRDFNREQQGDIIKDYYRNVVHGISPHAHEHDRIQQQLIKGEI